MTENHFPLARLDLIDEHAAVLRIPLHDSAARATLDSESTRRAVHKRLQLDNVHNKARIHVFPHFLSFVTSRGQMRVFVQRVSGPSLWFGGRGAHKSVHHSQLSHTVVQYRAAQREV